MKRILPLFLRFSLLLISLAIGVFLIRFPLLEGRAQHLDLISIYLDPFILFLYLAAVVFYGGCYFLFKLLTLWGNGTLYSNNTLVLLKRIKTASTIELIFVLAAGIFIRFSYNKNDDPAGFLAICIFLLLICLAVVMISNRYLRIIGQKITD